MPRAPNKSSRPELAVARILSKRGACSRAEAVRRIAAGRVTLNGRRVTNPEQMVPQGGELRIDGALVVAAELIYLALNKPRGMVTTAHDEKGRATVFDCFKGTTFPHLSAVGRLDQASEGLLLFTNDTAWAATLTDPSSHINKVYHVQIGVVADDPLLSKLVTGVTNDDDFLSVKHAMLLRHGDRNSWLELTIDEGKNRHLRRMFDSLEIEVHRLVRVAIDALELGDLAKGKWRMLTSEEVKQLTKPRAII